MRKSLCKKDTIWWNSELASLQKEACRAWRKAIKTKQEDWEAQTLALSYLKKAVRRAKRDSWHCFVESMNSQTPTAWLVKGGESSSQFLWFAIPKIELYFLF